MNFFLVFDEMIDVGVVESGQIFASTITLESVEWYVLVDLFVEIDQENKNCRFRLDLHHKGLVHQ